MPRVHGNDSLWEPITLSKIITELGDGKMMPKHNDIISITMLYSSAKKIHVISENPSYIPSFVEICSLVPEKIFEGFSPYEHGGHLGHVTQMPRLNFCSPHTILGFDWPSSFREKDN